MQRHPRHHPPGFTLIEVCVAIVVLAIGMLGMSRLTVATVAVQTANAHLAQASALLQDSLERLKASGYGTTPPGTVTNDYGALGHYNPSNTTNTAFDYSTYKRVTSIVANTPAANMKTVTVTVFWQNDTQALSASTMVAEQ